MADTTRKLVHSAWNAVNAVRDAGAIRCWRTNEPTNTPATTFHRNARIRRPTCNDASNNSLHSPYCIIAKLAIVVSLSYITPKQHTKSTQAGSHANYTGQRYNSSRKSAVFTLYSYHHLHAHALLLLPP